MEKIDVHYKSYGVQDCVSTVPRIIRSVIEKTYAESFTDGLRDRVEVAIWKPLNITANFRTKIKNVIKKATL